MYFKIFLTFVSNSNNNFSLFIQSKVQYIPNNSFSYIYNRFFKCFLYINNTFHVYMLHYHTKHCIFYPYSFSLKLSLVLIFISLTKDLFLHLFKDCGSLSSILPSFLPSFLSSFFPLPSAKLVVRDEGV